MDIKATLHSFRDSLNGNESLLRETLRTQITERIHSPSIAATDRAQALQLLVTSWLRDGHLHTAAQFRDSATPEVRELLKRLEHFQTTPFTADEIDLFRHHVRSLADFDSCLLRALLDCFQLDESGQWAEAQERKINLMMLALTPDSRLRWRKMQSLLIKNQVCRLEMRMEERQIIYCGQRVDFGSKRSLFQILKLLSTTPQMPVEDAVRILWQTEMGESYFARLRTATQRLNEILGRFLPVQKAIELNSKELKLSSALQLYIQAE